MLNQAGPASFLAVLGMVSADLGGKWLIMRGHVMLVRVTMIYIYHSGAAVSPMTGNNCCFNKIWDITFIMKAGKAWRIAGIDGERTYLFFLRPLWLRYAY